MGILKLLGQTPAAPQVQDIGALQRFCDQVNDICSVLMIIMLAVVGLSAVVFGVYVGFRLAKAEDEGKRKEAKQQLIWAIVAVVACVAIVLIIQFAFNGTIFGAGAQTLTSGRTTVDDVLLKSGQQVLDVISSALSALFTLATVAGTVFGVYVAIGLAMAQDEGKRKEKKQQLIWTIVGIVGAIAVAIVVNQIMNLLISFVG